MDHTVLRTATMVKQPLLFHHPESRASIGSMGDLRRDGRKAFSGKISVTWSDEHGDPCTRNGECLDISTRGLKVKVDSEIPARTVVIVKARELDLHGSASVRSCTRVGARYILGLEFVGGLKWQPPETLAGAGNQ